MTTRTRILIGALIMLILVPWVVSGFSHYGQQLKNGAALAITSQGFSKDYNVGNPESPAITYLVLGDSTAAGTGGSRVEESVPHMVATTIAARGYYVKVVNRSKIAAKIHDVESQQLKELAVVKPNIVTLQVGANNATRLTPFNLYRKDLASVVEGLKGSTATSIAVTTTPDIGLIPGLPGPFRSLSNQWAIRQNQMLQDNLRGTNIKSADIFADGKLNPNQDQSLYAADRFHPSPKGYQVWADIISSQITLSEAPSPQRRQ